MPIIVTLQPDGSEVYSLGKPDGMRQDVPYWWAEDGKHPAVRALGLMPIGYSIEMLADICVRCSPRGYLARTLYWAERRLWWCGLKWLYRHGVFEIPEYERVTWRGIMRGFTLNPVEWRRRHVRRQQRWH